MTRPACPRCGYVPLPVAGIPPEPPLGTWVRDRHGATHVRRRDGDGRDGWSGGPGFYSFGKWEAMWTARGPLTICGPYGAELPEPPDAARLAREDANEEGVAAQLYGGAEITEEG